MSCNKTQASGRIRDAQARKQIKSHWARHGWLVGVYNQDVTKMKLLPRAASWDKAMAFTEPRPESASSTGSVAEHAGTLDMMVELSSAAWPR